MKKIWFFIYNFLFLPLLYTALIFLRIFNSKVRRGFKGRKNLFSRFSLKAGQLDKEKKNVWFHSASMGEFEQAKPIIEQLKKESDVNLIVTFFSPSGYENSLKYPYADIVEYIPFDTPSKAEKFITLLKPDVAVFMRYDIWPNFIWKLKQFNIPLFIVDATMRKDSKRKWIVSKNFHKHIFKLITRILCVSENDLKNFLDFGLSEKQLKAVGDTRFDRVYMKCIEAESKKLFKDNFFQGKKILVCGSSWESDEEVLLPAIIKLNRYVDDLITILVPHEPTELRLEKIENELTGKTTFLRFSYRNNYNGHKFIIIDSIGILLTLYYYADIAYVGGSFKQGIHNVLEPAVYGIPVIFGTKIQNSQEAQELANRGAGMVVRNKKEAYRKLRFLLGNNDERKKLGEISTNYVNENIGATNKIVEEIKMFL